MRCPGLRGSRVPSAAGRGAARGSSAALRIAAPSSVNEPETRCRPLPRSVTVNDRDASARSSLSGVPSGSRTASMWRARRVICPECSSRPSRSRNSCAWVNSPGEACGSTRRSPAATARAWEAFNFPCRSASPVAWAFVPSSCAVFTREVPSPGCRCSWRASHNAVEVCPSAAARPRLSHSRTTVNPIAANTASPSSRSRNARTRSRFEAVHTESAASIAAALRASATAFASKVNAGCSAAASAARAAAGSAPAPCPSAPAIMTEFYRISNICSIPWTTSSASAVTAF